MRSAIVLVLVVLGTASATASWTTATADHIAVPLATLPAARLTPTPAPAAGLGPGTYIVVRDVPGGVVFHVCTANFVWLDADAVAYLGTAGHCYDHAGQFGQACIADCTFGGQTGQVLQGQMVTLGPLVYRRVGDPGNDFALVRVREEHLGLLRAEMPVWGGPTATACPSGPLQGADSRPVVWYGNAQVLGETFLTRARPGTLACASGDDRCWDFLDAVFRGCFAFAGPVRVMDSGSAVNLGQAREDGALHGREALGILTHALFLRKHVQPRADGTFQPVEVAIPVGAMGTTVERAQALVLRDLGLAIRPLCQGGVGC
jgi:hypothetical protein